MVCFIVAESILFKFADYLGWRVFLAAHTVYILYDHLAWLKIIKTIYVTLTLENIKNYYKNSTGFILLSLKQEHLNSI